MAGGEAVKLEQWPKDKIPPGALCKQEDMDNRRTRQRIFAGQPILEPMLLHAGEVPLDAQIPKGLRVVAIPIGPEAIHSGLVVPGARCDVQVFMRADASIGVAETIAKTILQDIRVFAVNDITNLQQQQPSPGSDPKAPEAPHSIPTGKTVSLLVTPAQAEVVTLASQLGTIRLILRSGDDTEQVKYDSVRARELLGGLTGANREMENRKKADNEVFDMWFKMVKKSLESTSGKTASANPSRHAARVDDMPHYKMTLRLGSENPSDVILTANVGPNGVADDAAWTATSLPTPSKPTTETHVPISTTVAPVAAPTGGTATKQSNDATSPASKTNGKPPMGS
jgi:Flp pilus assembly protein CpaB